MGIWNDRIRWYLLAASNTEQLNIFLQELAFRQRPFAHLSDCQVLTALVDHTTPSFPAVLLNDPRGEEARVIQDVCSACWRCSPYQRPGMSWVLRKLSDLTERAPCNSGEGKLLARSESVSLRPLPLVSSQPIQPCFSENTLWYP